MAARPIYWNEAGIIAVMSEAEGWSYTRVKRGKFDEGKMIYRALTNIYVILAGGVILATLAIWFGG